MAVVADFSKERNCAVQEEYVWRTNQNQTKSIKLFLQWKGFPRARAWEQRCWRFTLTASHIHLGNKRNIRVILSNKPTYSSLKSPVEARGSFPCHRGRSQRHRAGERCPGQAPSSAPFPSAAARRLEANLKASALKRDFSTSHSPDKCLSATLCLLPPSLYSRLFHLNNGGSHLNGIQGDNFTELN